MLEDDRPHGLKYEVPKGWCGFGLRAHARSERFNVFQDWAVSFHGTKSSTIISILDNNGLFSFKSQAIR